MLRPYDSLPTPPPTTRCYNPRMSFATYNQRPIELAPSILAADFADLGAQCRAAIAAGAGALHIDVMDGAFVPNISIGLPVVASLRQALPAALLDCHLMVAQPERFVPDFVAAGASRITVHAEATLHLHRALRQIRDLGLPAGVALNPATPLASIEDLIGEFDLLLIMSVNPGFGGQRYIAHATDKLARARALLDARGLGDVILQVDGGVNAATLPAVLRAGATSFVAGSAVFDPRRRVDAAVAELRAAAGNP